MPLTTRSLPFSAAGGAFVRRPFHLFVAVLVSAKAAAVGAARAVRNRGEWPRRLYEAAVASAGGVVGANPRTMSKYLLLLVFVTLNLALWYLYAVNFVRVTSLGRDARDRDFFYTDEEDDGPLVSHILNLPVRV